MTAPDEDLMATEGVDEGSATSTAEGKDSGATSTEELTGTQNPLERAIGEPKSSSPAGESDPAPPDDMDSESSREARDERGTGLQTNTGQG